ncbi:unnamed protein product [Urochloa humidicola]
MGKKKGKGILLKKAVKVAKAQPLHFLQAASVSVRETLSVFSFVNMYLATKVAKSGKLPAGDPWWWAVGGAFSTGMLAMWVVILMFVDPTRYPTIAKILLWFNVAALAVLLAVGEIDPTSFIEFFLNLKRRLLCCWWGRLQQIRWTA